MSRLRLLLVPAVLALGMGLAACDDDDDGENGDLGTEVQGARETAAGAVETAGGEIDSAVTELADDFEDAADEVASGDTEAGDELNQKCSDLAGRAPSALQGAIQRICTEVQEAIDSADGDRLREIADRLRGLVD
jgi:uncharacterized protein YjbJ (UPF0337 family)